MDDNSEDEGEEDRNEKSAGVSKGKINTVLSVKKSRRKGKK